MTPPDSLEAAIRAVPCRICGADLTVLHQDHDWNPSVDALAAAVRGWMRVQLGRVIINCESVETEEGRLVLADVARRLGL